MLQSGLSMKNINKSFSGVQILKGVNLDIRPGEVHALLGENGAGKSTLMKILTGIYSSDEGEISKDNKTIIVKNPDDARRQGITMIHQELCLVPEMMVAENIFLGNWPSRGKMKTLDRKTMLQRSQNILDQLNMAVDASETTQKLSVAQQQMVEIARSLSFNADVIIMDEPTSSLTQVEVDGMMKKIKELREQGISIIYISHKMEEIFELCDRVTVMRDGLTVGTRDIAKTTPDELVQLMVGREISQMYTDRKPVGKEVVLEANELTNKYLKEVSFTLKRGEILGIYGLVGAGRTELSRALFGIDPIRKGYVKINDKVVQIKNTGDAIRNGIALVPEDRKQHGLILSQSVKNNMTLPVLWKFIKNLRINKKKEAEIIDQYKDSFSIKMSSVHQLCSRLSGGNQQKVVISKWLASEPTILILDEPTRGIDVGAKSEIYRIITQLAEEGMSIIMISSEMPEILNLSSRIAVMHEGKMTAIIDSNEGSIMSEHLLKYAIGGTAQ